MSKSTTYTCDGCKKKMTDAEVGGKLIVREPVNISGQDFCNTYHFCSWLCLGKRCKREVH